MKEFLLVWSVFSYTALAETLPSWFPKFLGAKATIVGQYSTKFNSPYEGPMTFGNLYNNSGVGRSEEVTQSYSIYAGAQLTKNLQAYFDIGLFIENGMGEGQGVGGYPNALYIRAGSSDLGKRPYIARAYILYRKALSNRLDYQDRAPDQLAGYYPEEYVYLKIGKFSISDGFDNNRYANSPETNFLNYDFNYNTAWDYGADTRGFTVGIEGGVIEKLFSLKLAVGAEPTKANGNTYDESSYSINAQISLRPDDKGTVIRVLGMLNYGQMGSYEEAIKRFNYFYNPLSPCYNSEYGPNGVYPLYDYPLICTESKDHRRHKWGIFINFEQPIVDDGTAGVFLRAGFNNGQTEDFAYTDVDRDMAGGISINALHFGRPEDTFGIGLAINALSTPHRQYLETGAKYGFASSSFFVGSGKNGQFNYGYEEIAEAYYRLQLSKYLSISPDAQYVRHPGYDKNRGPLWVYGLRLSAQL